MLSAQEWAVMTSDIFRIYSLFPREPEKAFRRFDGVTPYGVHPVLLAMFLLNEESLPEEFRVRGAKALLAHDLIEDTTAELPSWVKDSPDASPLVHGLTFSKRENKFVEIFNRGEEVILLGFFDNTFNLTATGRMKTERLAEYREGVRGHLAYIEPRYPRLEIVKMAKAFLQ